VLQQIGNRQLQLESRVMMRQVERKNLVKGRVTNSRKGDNAKCQKAATTQARQQHQLQVASCKMQHQQQQQQMQTRAAANTINFLFQPGQISW